MPAIFVGGGDSPWHNLELRATQIPAHQAALGVPVTQHDSLRFPIAQINRVYVRSVRMAMQQHIDAVLVDGFHYCTLVDIHDVHTEIKRLLETLTPGFFSNA